MTASSTSVAAGNSTGLLPDWQQRAEYYQRIFGDLPSELDPERRRERIETWTELLSQYCQKNHTASFTIAELQTAFELPLPGGVLRPRVFPALFSATPELFIPEASFLNTCRDLNQKILQPPGLASRLLSSVMPSVWSLLGFNAAPVTPEADTRFVFLPYLAQIWAQQRQVLAPRLTHPVEQVVPEAELLGELQQQLTPQLRESQCSLFLSYLVTLRAAVRFNADDIQGVKLLKDGEQFREATDTGILHLKHQIQVLNTLAERLSQQIQAETNQARRYLQEGNKAAALYRVKHRALLRQHCEQLHQTLHTLQSQLTSLTSAFSSEDILRALEAGSRALKTIQSDVSLERVTATLADVQETLDTQSEIDAALATPMTGLAGPVDDDELLRELDLLTAEAPLDNLPQLPSVADLPIPVAPAASSLPPLAASSAPPAPASLLIAS